MGFNRYIAPISILFAGCILVLLQSGPGLFAEEEGRPEADTRAAAENRDLHQVEIRTLPFLGLSTGRSDVNGRPVRVPCMTCHKEIAKVSAERIRTSESTFHRHIQLKHGAKTCHTCHNPENLTQFTLADGTTLEYQDVMQLCGQCHARRLTEYENGAHGGMNGYWDLESGPRTRNHCLDCHNPHAPAISPVIPAPRIRNRTFD